eukprot:SAG11_NODE_29971_length_305_cov_1.000000_1_plen_69_part_10
MAADAGKSLPARDYDHVPPAVSPTIQKKGRKDKKKERREEIYQKYWDGDKQAAISMTTHTIAVMNETLG